MRSKISGAKPGPSSLMVTSIVSSFHCVPTSTRSRAKSMAFPNKLPRIVVDGYESFTWGDEHLGPWAVSFHQYRVPWPMGFHVASRDPSIVLSRDYLQPRSE